MTHIFNPITTPLIAAESLALSKILQANKEQIFTVPLEDGTITMSAKWLIVNIFLWRPLVRRSQPVAKRHTFYDGLITSSRIAAQQTEIYTDVIIHQNGNADRETIRLLLEDLCESINDLHTMIVTQLGSYHLSISAFELCDLLECPDIKALTEVDVTQEMKIGITATEEKLKVAGDAVMKKLTDESLPGNVLAPFIALEALSNKQLPQLLVSFGHRKDASDSVVRYPVLTSGVKGMRDILDYAVMSLDAKLTTYYNKDAMPRAQYNSRKQQLLSSCIARLYPGDCGSTLTVPFLVTADNVKCVIDKNIRIEDGSLVRLTPSIAKEHIGKTVHFRSPLTCQHTDGICHVCGGYLTEFMPPQSVVGIICTIEYMGRTSQLVLSVKHFSKTREIAYPIPEQLRDLLEIRNNDIYLRKNVAVDRLKIGVQFRDISMIRHLQTTDDETDTEFNEQQFSTLHFIQFADVDNEMGQTPEVSMAVDDTVPYFSLEFLTHIHERFNSVTITEDWVWIPLRKFDHLNAPLMRYVVQSSSMIKFTQDLAKFATRKISQYTEIEYALRDFAQMVYSEVHPNIFHLECVLKSYLITSDSDYNVPVVRDINNVRFGSLQEIIPRRSLGGMFAYEQLAKHITDPAMYIFPHKTGFFDNFFYTPPD